MALLNFVAFALDRTAEPLVTEGFDDARSYRVALFDSTRIPIVAVEIVNAFYATKTITAGHSIIA